MVKQMEKLKVIFLTYCYPPQKYPRSVQISHLVQCLKEDFSLTVITSIPETEGDTSLLQFTPMNNVVYAKKSKITQFVANSRGSKLKKALLPDLYYLWHFDLLKKADYTIKQSSADIIVTFGQPMSTHIVGLKLKKKFPHLKWVAHFSDPWVDNSFNEYNFFNRAVNKYYQDSVFKEADKLVFTSEETVNLVMKNYPYSTRSKTALIPHCFDENLYECSQKKHDKFLIRYIGNFYGERQPTFLFEALKNIEKDLLQNIRIELIGTSTLALNECIKLYGLEESVFAFAPVSYLESLKMMKESDLLLIIDKPMEVSPFLPSKIVDYIGANKPIFGITPKGTSQKLIEEMGFLVADPHDTQAIQKQMSKIIENVRNVSIGKIPEHIRKKFSKETVCNQWRAEDILGVVAQIGLKGF
jgi:glycosyltransferase involved in cell wall biosynthesis